MIECGGDMVGGTEGQQSGATWSRCRSLLFLGSAETVAVAVVVYAAVEVELRLLLLAVLCSFSSPQPTPNARRAGCSGDATEMPAANRSRRSFSRYSGSATSALYLCTLLEADRVCAAHRAGAGSDSCVGGWVVFSRRSRWMWDSSVLR